MSEYLIFSLILFLMLVCIEHTFRYVTVWVFDTFSSNALSLFLSFLASISLDGTYTVDVSG